MRGIGRQALPYGICIMQIKNNNITNTAGRGSFHSILRPTLRIHKSFKLQDCVMC